MLIDEICCYFDQSNITYVKRLSYPSFFFLHKEEGDQLRQFWGNFSASHSRYQCSAAHMGFFERPGTILNGPCLNDVKDLCDLSSSQHVVGSLTDETVRQLIQQSTQHCLSKYRVLNFRLL